MGLVTYPLTLGNGWPSGHRKPQKAFSPGHVEPPPPPLIQGGLLSVMPSAGEGLFP